MTASSRRDRGLRRIASLTGGIAAGGIALSGALSAVVAHAVPGKSATATTVPSTSASTPARLSTSGTSATTLAPPVQTPTASSGRASVVSGGS